MTVQLRRNSAQATRTDPTTAAPPRVGFTQEEAPPSVLLVGAAINRVSCLVERINVIDGTISAHLNRILGDETEVECDDGKTSHVPDGTVHQLHGTLSLLERRVDVLFATVRRAEIL